MKILLFCPTYALSKGKLAIRKETRDSIDALIIPDDVNLTVKISNNNPRPITGVSKEDHENTLFQYQLARRLMLDGGYDALFTVEHDMIIPEDALVKMVNTKADVVYGLYLFRHGKPVLNCLRAVRARWVDMSISFFPDLRKRGFKQGWLECSGAGYGCTLIHRRVLEKLEFRRSKEGHPSSDIPLAVDCLRNNFKQICRFDVQCGHIKSDGQVLWPTLEGSEVKMANVKIYVHRSFNAQIAGRSAHFEAGQQSEIPEDVVNEYVRAGFVGIVADKPAVKVVQKPEAKAPKSVKKTPVKKAVKKEDD